MSRRLLVCAALALVFASPAAAAPSWALPQIKVVTAKGLMGGTATGFRPDDPLTQGELADLVTGLTGKTAPVPADPAALATIGQLDAQLVRALGLLPAARQFTAGVRAAGLVPRNGFGTEVAARLLGLRVDHPAAQDLLEPRPTDLASRAEAAYSAARILGFTGDEDDYVTKLAGAFQLPALSGLQRDLLQTAISLVGYPYVWGGTSELPQDPFGTRKLVPGGFDCSGFVMFVYAQVGVSLPHHAADQFYYGVPVSRDQLEPGDLVFFDGLGHVGIYIGGGQFVHAPHTGDVVKISSLNDSWYAATYVGARRI